MTQTDLGSARVLHTRTNATLFAAAFVAAVGLFGAWLPPAARSQVESSVQVSLDAPTVTDRVAAGQFVLVLGWAVDPSGAGTGVDQIRIFLDGPAGGTGQWIGVADYGLLRTDVAAVTGRPLWTTSGYAFRFPSDGLSIGTHSIYVYAHSAANGTWGSAATTFMVDPPVIPTPIALVPTPVPTAVPISTPVLAPGSIPPPPPQQMGGPPPLPPAPYQGQPTVQAVASDEGTVMLNWQPSSEADFYRVYRALTPDPLAFTVIQTLRQNLNQLISSAQVSGLSPGYTYYFQVRTVNNRGGQESYTPTASGSVVGFAPTTNGLASSSGTIYLSWSPIALAQSYRVYTSQTGIADSFSLARTLPQIVGGVVLNTTISGLVPGSSHHFQVRVVEASGAEHVVSSTTVQPIDAVPAPGTLNVTSVSTNSVAMAWYPSADAVMYRVYLSPTGNTGSYVPVTLSLPNSNGATVTNLQPGKAYWFYVTGLSLFGQESGPSNTISSTTTLLAPNTPIVPSVPSVPTVSPVPTVQSVPFLL